MYGNHLVWKEECKIKNLNFDNQIALLWYSRLDWYCFVVGYHGTSHKSSMNTLSLYLTSALLCAETAMGSKNSVQAFIEQ